MRHLDALGEIPEELIGVYDVVQLRLFQVVVKDNDPGPLLRNVVSMLSAVPQFFFPHLISSHTIHPSSTLHSRHIGLFCLCEKNSLQCCDL